MQMKITLIIIGINSNVHFHYSAMFCQILSVLLHWFLPFFFPFPFFPFSSSCFPSSLSYSSSSSHLFIFFLSFPFFFPSFLPPLWKKEKMTPTLRPSLWSHRQPATSSSPLPVRGSRSQVQEGIIGLAGLVLLFIVFPWPIGSSANFWSAPGSLPWSGPSTNLALSSPCISISPFSGCLCISSN